MKPERNSIFELLRIICIFGIVSMHSSIFVSAMYSNNGIGKVICLDLVNLFNVCVSLFVLISGYFSIRYSHKKLFSFWWQVFCCSLISIPLHYLHTHSLNFVYLTSSLFPILSNKYWFASSYLILMVFSPILNIATETMSKKSFTITLAIILLVFCILPTLFCYSLPGTGKGPFHLFMMYLLGRYIAQYPPKFTRKALVCLLFFSWLLLLSGNLCTHYLYTSLTNDSRLCFVLCRDSSILIVLASVTIFLLIKQYQFKSTCVNRIAKHVFCIYLVEGGIRSVINSYIPHVTNLSLASFPLVLLIYVMTVVLAGLAIGMLLSLLNRYLEPRLFHLVELLYLKISPPIKQVLHRYFS